MTYTPFHHLPGSPRFRALSRIRRAVAAMLCVAAMCVAAGCGGASSPAATSGPGVSVSPSSASPSTEPLDALSLSAPASSPTPSPANGPEARAKAAVAAMDVEERVGQLVMVPLVAGTDAAMTSAMIRDDHAGSVLLLGNWRNGTAGVRKVVDALRAAAPAGAGLIIAADQEGGKVQHLKGSGFATMPSARKQGGMSVDGLRAQAASWGRALADAGVNVDLAPVADTVRIARSSNAPIGALNRDFGLDAVGNAAHAAAFVAGMRDAGVMAAVKHYPGLGGVSGNTDFTAEGIVDSATALGDGPTAAFDGLIRDGAPAMVMMALATYPRIDGTAPAAFSSRIVDGHLRGEVGYRGVVISDSLSAEALGDVPHDQLGVRLVEAGGDLACIGEPDLVRPIVDGLTAKARADQAFAAKVTASAERVMTLKASMGLLD